MFFFSEEEAKEEAKEKEEEEEEEEECLEHFIKSRREVQAATNFGEITEAAKGALSSPIIIPLV